MSSKDRFYEKDPLVKQAVDAMFLFPPEVQVIIASGFSLIAESDCKAKELMNDSKSLGTEKVLALYKSKQKRRPYDFDPTLHQAMNYLMIMSEENRRFLATKIIEMIGFMQDYLKVCQEYTEAPQSQTIEGITKTYSRQGPTEAKAFINSVKAEFERKLKGGSAQGVTPQSSQGTSPKKQDKDAVVSEAIASESSGMRIKADLI